MAVETIAGPTRRVSLLYRNSAAVHSAGTALSGMARAEGHQRIVGAVEVSTAQATGFPRIRQSADGVTWTIVDVILRDTDQGNFTYPFDIDLKLPYVQIQTQQGGVDSTFIRINAFVTPIPNLDVDLATAPSTVWIQSTPGTDFALASGSEQQANITGLGADTGLIRHLGIVTLDNLDYEISFWNADTFASATLANDTFIGSFTFLATDAVVMPNAPAGTTVYRYDMSNLYMPYKDEDGTQELHVQVRPLNGATGGGSRFKLIIGFEQGQN